MAKTTEVLNSKNLTLIATHLCNDWVKLLLKLKLSYQDINAIENTYPNNIQKQALEALERWKEKNIKENTSIEVMMLCMKKALEEIERPDIVEIIEARIAGSVKKKKKNSRRQLKTVHLDDIASQLIGDSVWTKVLYHLGLSYNELKIIESMYPMNVQRQALEGLVRWKRKKSKKESSDTMMNKLVKALQDVDRQDVIDWIKDTLEREEAVDSETEDTEISVICTVHTVVRERDDTKQKQNELQETTTDLVDTLQRNVVDFTTELVGNIQNMVNGQNTLKRAENESDETRRPSQELRNKCLVALPFGLLLVFVIILILMIIIVSVPGIIVVIVILVVLIVAFVVLMRRKRANDREYQRQIEYMRLAKQETKVEIDMRKTTKDRKETVETDCVTQAVAIASTTEDTSGASEQHVVDIDSTTNHDPSTSIVLPLDEAKADNIQNEIETNITSNTTEINNLKDEHTAYNPEHEEETNNPEEEFGNPKHDVENDTPKHEIETVNVANDNLTDMITIYNSKNGVETELKTDDTEKCFQEHVNEPNELKTRESPKEKNIDQLSADNFVSLVDTLEAASISSHKVTGDPPSYEKFEQTNSDDDGKLHEYNNDRKDEY